MANTSPTGAHAVGSQRAQWIRDHPLAAAAMGTLLAIGGTTALDAIGFGLDVLPLAVVFFLFVYLQRLSRREIGLTWAHWRDYGVAVVFPVLLLALVGMVAWLSGAVAVHKIDWSQTLVTFFVANLVPTIVLGLVTEEGVFRGWLWASLRRARMADLWVLTLTSAAFAAWHIPSAFLLSGVRVPLGEVPVYVVNAGVIGFAWALMRRRSGSIVVTSVSHGLWNSFAYVLFGEGTAIGLLGVHNAAVFSPEVGVVGLGLNVTLAVALWLGYGRSRAASPTTP